MMMRCSESDLRVGYEEIELYDEIHELASQIDPSDPKFIWKQQQIRRILDMITAKFTSLHLHYDHEIAEYKQQIKNRNHQIEQLEVALQELMEKYRQHREEEGW